MKTTKKKSKNSYTQEFKAQAIELAKELGAKDAAEKLGIEKFQTLAAWVRYSKKVDENKEFRELQDAKAEIKKLKKELEREKK